MMTIILQVEWQFPLPDQIDTLLSVHEQVHCYVLEFIGYLGAVLKVVSRIFRSGLEYSLGTQMMNLSWLSWTGGARKNLDRGSPILVEIGRLCRFSKAVTRAYACQIKHLNLRRKSF